MYALYIYQVYSVHFSLARISVSQQFFIYSASKGKIDFFSRSVPKDVDWLRCKHLGWTVVTLCSVRCLRVWTLYERSRAHRHIQVIDLRKMWSSSSVENCLLMRHSKQQRNLLPKLIATYEWLFDVFLQFSLFSVSDERCLSRSKEKAFIDRRYRSFVLFI